MNRLEPENGNGSFGQSVNAVERYINPLTSFATQSGEGRRYKYHDRGDGMYDDARKLGQQPHLVTTGEHAGRSNVKFVGMFDRHLWIKDTFTSIVQIWIVYLFLLMIGVYFVSYLFFAILWYTLYIVTHTCVHFPANDEDGFLAAYMFSLETQATIGFGSRTVGVCISSAIVLTLQNVTGMILDAVTLGIIFAKLSHPKHRGRSVLISETATIARRDGQLKFMFRIADCRSSTALDAKVSAFLYTWGNGRNTMEGEHMPVRVEPMEVRGIQSMLLLPTIMEHPIDERSPLFNLNYDNLAAMQAEIVVTFEAVSDFGDSFMVRRSYLGTEIHWGYMFIPITNKAPSGDMQHIVNLSLFHDVTPQPDLPSLPPGPLSRHVLMSGLPGQTHSLPYPELGENTIVISGVCALSSREGVKQLVFRVGDTRPGHVIEARVRAYLFEWSDALTREGEKMPYTIKELAVGYESGADRLIMRFPQLVTHTITPQSPMAPWSDTKSVPKYPAELVVVVEGVLFYNSSSVMRTLTYKLPENLKRGHSFVPMVSRGGSVTAVPVVNWQAFHATVKTGTTWVPGPATPGDAASAKLDPTSGMGGGNFGNFQLGSASNPRSAAAGGLAGGEVEMSAQ